MQRTVCVCLCVLTTIDERLALVDGHGLFQGLALPDGLQQLVSGLGRISALFGAAAAESRWSGRWRRRWWARRRCRRRRRRRWERHAGRVRFQGPVRDDKERGGRLRSVDLGAVRRSNGIGVDIGRTFAANVRVRTRVCQCHTRWARSDDGAK